MIMGRKKQETGRSDTRKVGNDKKLKFSPKRARRYMA
jgi:hypothetical protein